MAFPTFLPSGALHPDLVNNSPFVKYVDGDAAEQSAGTEARGAKVHGMDDSPQKIVQKGRTDVIDLSDRFTRHHGTEPDGKKVIYNRPSSGLIVETINPAITTAEDANRSAAAGGPTHGFFYRSTDFLLDAAKEYAALGEDEVFYHRNIADVNFVRDALDFFTDGNYSQSDVSAVQEQITGGVRELAQQLKNGENPDLNKLQSKLTIGGADVTVSQLMDMQKVGKEMSNALSDISSGSLNAQNIQSFANMGIAKAVGTQYGNSRGQIGKLFSTAIDRMYEKSVALVQRADDWGRTTGQSGYTSCTQNAVKTELGISELFSKMDTSSTTNLAKSFANTLSQARTLVQQHCNQYGLLTSHVGLASATDGLMKQFQTWMSKL